MNDRLDVILDLTRRLSALVEREITLLQTRQPHRLAEHEEERTRLSLLYAREMQAMRADPAAARALDKRRIEQLKEDTAAFNAALDRHKRLVARMRRVTEGIIKSIADEAVRQKAPRSVYGATGYTATTKAAAPLAVNRRV
jgi:hypothetical protein